MDSECNDHLVKLIWGYVEDDVNKVLEIVYLIAGTSSHVSSRCSGAVFNVIPMKDWVRCVDSERSSWCWCVSCFASQRCVLGCFSVGLFETLCDHVRHVHNQLNLEALDLAKSSASSKKKVSRCEVLFPAAAAAAGIWCSNETRLLILSFSLMWTSEFCYNTIACDVCIFLLLLRLPL